MKITMVDFAIRDMKQLPKLPTKPQHLRVLRGLVKLNKLVAKASENEQEVQRTRHIQWTRCCPRLCAYSQTLSRLACSSWKSAYGVPNETRSASLFCLV